MIRKLIRSITKSEWYFVAAITIFVILITTAPYIYGWLQAPDGYTYNGLHSLTPGDIHVYYSYINQAREGHLFFTDQYTAEPQSRIMLNSFWAIVGYSAKIFHLSNLIVFQLARIILIPLLFFVIYILASYFFKERIWRQVSFIFLVFASGIGTLAYLIKWDPIYSNVWYDWPLDIWGAEHNIFSIAFHSPHLVASATLFILMLFFSFLAIENYKIKYCVLAGIIGLILFQFHPFHIVTIFSILVFYFLILFFKNIKNLKLKDTQNRLFNQVKYSLIIVLISLPSIIYYILLSEYDFVTQVRIFQNVCLTPSFPIVFLSYGFLLIFALLGIYSLFKNKQLDNKNIFIISWFLVQLALMFSPLLYQRRLMECLTIPLSILSIYGLQFIYKFLNQKLKKETFNFWVNNKYLLIFIFIFIFASSHVFLLYRELKLFNEQFIKFYTPITKIAAYKWLNENTDSEAVVISSVYDGNFIPGQAGRYVYVGHGIETLFYNSKSYRVDWLFGSNEFDDKKLEFFKNENINYIFYTQELREVGNYNPDEKEYLNLVFQEGDVKIYQVVY